MQQRVNSIDKLGQISVVKSALVLVSDTLLYFLSHKPSKTWARLYLIAIITSKTSVTPEKKLLKFIWLDLVIDLEEKIFLNFDCRCIIEYCQYRNFFFNIELRLDRYTVRLWFIEYENEFIYKKPVQNQHNERKDQST